MWRQNQKYFLNTHDWVDSTSRPGAAVWWWAVVVCHLYTTLAPAPHKACHSSLSGSLKIWNLVHRWCMVNGHVCFLTVFSPNCTGAESWILCPSQVSLDKGRCSLGSERQSFNVVVSALENHSNFGADLRFEFSVVICATFCLLQKINFILLAKKITQTLNISLHDKWLQWNPKTN